MRLYHGSVIVDTLTTRGRGLGAAVATVVVLLLAIPATASAALSINVNPTSPRPGEPVSISASGTCDGTCWSWSWKVGSTVVDAGGGFPDPYVYEDGFPTTGERRVTLNYSRLSFTPPYEFEVTKTFNVVANRAPVASFSFNPTVPIINQLVTFTDTSTDPEGDTLTRAWDTDNDGAFDDGDGTTASRSFPTAGARQVRLRVRDQYGAETISSRTVTVANGGPQITLSVTPTTVPTGSPVAFSAAGTDPDGGPVTYAWDLDGDGVYNDSTAAVPPARSYPRARTLNISVRVTDDDGTDVSTGQRDQIITVTNRLPSVPTISSAPGSAVPGESVQLTAAATDPEGTALTYAWDLDDDGAFDDGTGASLSRAMPATGPLTAQVRVTDADNGSATSSRFTLNPANRPPVASFTVSEPSPAIGQTITLTDTSTDPDGQTLTRTWDLDDDGEFDDGTGATPTTSFSTPGTKTIRMRASDGAAGVIASRTVTVRNLTPTGTLSVTPKAVPTGTPVSFSVTAADPDGGAVTYAWDLDGDGAYDDSTSATPPAQSYARSGARTVGVRVTDTDGDAATATLQLTDTVTVTNRAPSVPTIVSVPGVAVRGQVVSLTAAATDPEGTAVTYAWDLDDDGAFDDATGASVDRTMPAAGVLAARVRATDADNGTTDSAPFTLTAGNRAPVAAFTASTTTPKVGEPVTFTDTSTDADGQALTRAWDLDGDGDFDDGTAASATFSFPAAGAVTVRLRVSDGIDPSVATRAITVSNVQPTGTLTVTPKTVQTGVPVAFSVTATDPDGGAVTYAWDLDGDGAYDDSTSATPPARSYARSGVRTIGVRITDTDGDAATATLQLTDTVTVTNRAPSVPTITSVPGAAVRGQIVSLTAAATDPEGTAVTYAWDLDDDGAFDDGTGANADRTMPASGVLAAKVRATDTDGGTTDSAPFTLTATDPVPADPPAGDPPPAPAPDPSVIATGTPFVSDPAPAPVPAPVATPPATKPSAAREKTTPLRLLRPFPRVRIQGNLTRRGARFTRITVTAPRGTRVRADCSGRGCPRKRVTKTTGRSGVIRLTPMLGSFRSGVKITIRATRAGAIGKYTQIVVRRGKAPRRIDRCLRPGATVPTRCPAN